MRGRLGRGIWALNWKGSPIEWATLYSFSQATTATPFVVAYIESLHYGKGTTTTTTTATTTHATTKAKDSRMVEVVVTWAHSVSPQRTRRCVSRDRSCGIWETIDSSARRPSRLAIYQTTNQQSNILTTIPICCCYPIRLWLDVCRPSLVCHIATHSHSHALSLTHTHAHSHIIFTLTLSLNLTGKCEVVFMEKPIYAKRRFTKHQDGETHGTESNNIDTIPKMEKPGMKFKRGNIYYHA